MGNLQFIRNFSIIAHIDHGKSTLADRILEITHTVSEREMIEQYLDTMELEREHGITIKAKAVRLNYKSRDGNNYIFNLIDTPGHVDFTYEVSRSLAACEGALLVVDATQGVEAQTVANTLLALANHLEIIPVINKIDLPQADPDRVKKEIEEALGIDASEAYLVSAKTGEGIEEVLEAIVKKIPPPSGNATSSLRALIFDSVFSAYRGVITFVRVFDGSVKPQDSIKMMASGRIAEVEEVGVFRPSMEKSEKLVCGEVGYIITGIKDVQETKIGDTVTLAKNPAREPLPGYKEPKPMVFAGFYPVEGGEYEDLRDALGKLRLNDPAFVYEPETSLALGFGFRCGFLGLLHMEIVRERLEREFELKVLVSAPTVEYKVRKRDKTVVTARGALQFPPSSEIEAIEEPYVLATIITPPDYIGDVFDLGEDYRGEFKDMQYLSKERVQLRVYFPLSEIILDFYDRLKSRTKGYASFDYEHVGYREADLVRLDVLVAGEVVDALSMIVERKRAYTYGRRLVEKLKEVIPRQLFEVPVQAAIGKKVIARETIKALRKDVTAKLYGGDVTRKRKLLEKQKAGKKRMKKIGKVEIPQEAFLAILRIEKEKA